MSLNLIREKTKTFPEVENPLAYRAIQIHYCRYQTLEPLKQFKNLEEITIIGCPDATLDFLAELKKTRKLTLLNFLKADDISPLSNLKDLEELELGVTIGLFRTHVIKSLEPLAGLTHLKRVGLDAVRMADATLKPLHKCPNLCKFYCPNFLPMEEWLHLKAVNPQITGVFFEPIVDLPYGVCRRCGSKRVLLSGVPKYCFKCTKCHHKRIQRHMKEWQALEERFRMLEKAKPLIGHVYN